MTERLLLYKLRRGLGGAIIEIQTNPERTRYRDIVLRCCLKDISYDPQSEGTKGHYLYTAICALGAKDEFEEIIIDAFMKRLEYRLFQQLADILSLYADDGSEKSSSALLTKYQHLAEQLSRQRAFPLRYCEREQFEYLMICEVDAYKWPAFKECVADAGRISMMRKDDACYCYDWFLCHSEDLFGKERVARYFDSAQEKSEEVKAFVTTINELEKIRQENSRLRVEPVVTLESYVARARELEDDKYAYMRMSFSAMRFSRQSNDNDLLKLVSIIESEPSDRVRANLLRIFRYIDFPSDIHLIIKYAASNFEQLHNIAIDALERFKDSRVRELALKLITAGNLDSGLPLLRNNWRKQDDLLIRECVLSSKKVTHTMQQCLRDIYFKHRSKSCGDILEHVYNYGECAYCRSAIVNTMWKNRVLRKSILDECHYDSYYETRKMAKRIEKYFKNK